MIGGVVEINKYIDYYRTPKKAVFVESDDSMVAKRRSKCVQPNSFDGQKNDMAKYIQSIDLLKITNGLLIKFNRNKCHTMQNDFSAFIIRPLEVFSRCCK